MAESNQGGGRRKTAGQLGGLEHRNMVGGAPVSVIVTGRLDYDVCNVAPFGSWRMTIVLQERDVHDVGQI